jgi:succinate-semialdehyde dehydrogenase/glutarate-semialdehyde dehydrogenase
MNREPFGPICAVMPFAGIDEVIAESNRLGYGLAAYVFTRSARNAYEITEALEVGSIGLNTFAVVSPETPWGGVKDSGHGAEGGSEGLASYLVTKYVASVAV